MMIHGDARSIPLPDRSVQCVVTSPPYWGLRDYGVDGQIGLEKTPDEYVQTLVQVFRELKRVLRDDGVVWLNLGDSYAGGVMAPPGTEKQASNRGASAGVGIDKSGHGLKSKDLVGIPWRVAFALQADGWYLRCDIIWAKPNPMPESVTDRPTRSHEYVFLLTKSERYYYDHVAVREPYAADSVARTQRGGPTGRKSDHKYKDGGPGGQTLARDVSAGCTWAGRNARSVWTITPKPFKEAHFATFPPELPTRCIKAGTPEGGSCAACGAPRTRIIEKGAPLLAQQQACGGDATGAYDGQATKPFAESGAQDASATKARILAGMVERKTVGWKQTCRCHDATFIPATVFDPFGGAGTTVLAAEMLGRRGIALELNPAYVAIAEARLSNRPTDRPTSKPATAAATPASMPVGRQD